MSYFSLLFHATLETLFTVIGASLVGVLIGAPFGAYLFAISPFGHSPRRILYKALSVFTNITRSLPYLILMILLIPVTRCIIGSAIGTAAALVPLSLASFLLIARTTEDTMSGLSKEFIEVGLVLGASPSFITFKIILHEVLPILVLNIASVIINLIGFSAMAGTVGGGGLGDLAVRYGYQRYDFSLLFLIVIILAVIVQCIQFSAGYISKRLRR